MGGFPQKLEEGIGSPEAGVKGSWELPAVGAATEIPFLYKRSKCLNR